MAQRNGQEAALCQRQQVSCKQQEAKTSSNSAHAIFILQSLFKAARWPTNPHGPCLLVCLLQTKIESKKKQTLDLDVSQALVSIQNGECSNSTGLLQQSRQTLCTTIAGGLLHRQRLRQDASPLTPVSNQGR